MERCLESLKEFDNSYRSLSKDYSCDECSFEDNIDGWGFNSLENKLVCPHCETLKSI